MSCGPSLRARLRRDAYSYADAHTGALGNIRADHRRAGRRSVGYELLRTAGCPFYYLESRIAYRL
jgi:hypothetical protein